MKLSDFKVKFEKELQPNEKILWIGEPRPRFNISLWNSISPGLTGADMSVNGPMPQGNAAGPMISLLVVILFYLGYWLAGFAMLAFLLFPDFVKHYRKRYTKYAITNKRIYFQLWWWGYSSTGSIDLTQIHKIHYEEFGKKCGPITFFIYHDQDFWTRDFMNSEVSVYPTFELVDNVEQEFSNIIELIRSNK